MKWIPLKQYLNKSWICKEKRKGKERKGKFLSLSNPCNFKFCKFSSVFLPFQRIGEKKDFQKGLILAKFFEYIT
jgi:hypothetical protein